MDGSDASLRKWITAVRGDDSIKVFAEKIYHLRNKGNTPVCLSYSRATISNWESGATAPPRDVETILSIALVEFDKTHGKDFDRNERYLFARGKLQEMLNIDLWCRNLHDAVLIQVCRGLLEFPDLPAFEAELLAEIRKITLTSIDKDEFAIERKTEAISNELTKAESKEQVRELITTKYANYFASQHWLTGARLRKIYNERNRIYGLNLPLRAAIVNLAPNYSNSFNNMFNGSFIGRGWLIDLCKHLRFSTEEINKVLEATHNAQLKGEETSSNGFSYFADKPLRERLEIMLLLGMYIASIDDESDELPVEYLLDPFRPEYESGKMLIRLLDEYLRDSADAETWDTEELFEQPFADKWNEAIWRAHDDEMFIPEISYELIEESAEYYKMNRPQTVHIRTYGDAYNLHLFTALSYTVLTGKQYTGQYHDSDLEEIRPLFRTSVNDLQGIYNNIFYFISHILGTFLGYAELFETEEGQFYVINEESENKRIKKMNIDTIIEDLADSIRIMQEEEATTE